MLQGATVVVRHCFVGLVTRTRSRGNVKVQALLDVCERHRVARQSPHLWNVSTSETSESGVRVALAMLFNTGIRSVLAAWMRLLA